MSPPFLQRNQNQTQLIVDGVPYLIFGGEVHNSSASCLDWMEASWDKIVACNCNTALVPVSWELVEPREGEFDFSLVDGLLRGMTRLLSAVEIASERPNGYIKGVLEFT